MLESEIVQGRCISSVEIAQIRSLIQANPRWSRWRLSRVLAEQWQWYSTSGQLKDMAARTLLLKLHQRKLIQLPERRRVPAQRFAGLEPEPLDAVTPALIAGDLASVLPLEVRLMLPKEPEYGRFQRYLAQHHYLGYGGPIGENLGYLVRSHAGQDLACLLFGAAAWQCAPRDRWIGWTSEQRAQGLQSIANNTRFLILPWVRLKSLASHILSQVAGRLTADWQRRYRHPIYLLETFVQADRFRGTCYQAANWVYVGQTTGRTRQNQRHRDNVVHAPVKDIFLYPLRPDGPGELCR